ncbi:MAG: NfeD family protein [Gammaproteobacteria bacterium]|nr:NfeD family protein [Gammaproteobacteria bacterium]
MVEYINTHQSEFWFAAGFLILIIDALILGFSSGVLLFAGIGGLVAGALMYVGIIPETWLAGISTFGISSGVTTILLWKPLMRFQNKPAPVKDNSSDLVGHTFHLTDAISRTIPGNTKYSGISWRVEMDDSSMEESLEAGTQVVVTSVETGLFRVKKKQ